MRRIRLLFVLFALALLAPLVLLVQRAVRSVALERQMRHQALAERVFDEMERGLSRLLEHEEEAASALEIAAAEREEFPFLLSRFEIEASGRIDLGEAATAKQDGRGIAAADRDEGELAAPAEIRGAVREFWRGMSDAQKEKRVDGGDATQQPGSTMKLYAKNQAAPPRLQEEKDTVSTYDALRSLNKAVQERVARQKKAESTDALPRSDDALVVQIEKAPAALGDRAAGEAPLAGSSVENEMVGGRGAAEPVAPPASVFDEPAPLQGRIIDARHAVLSRSLVRDGGIRRRGVLLDVPRLQEWLRGQALSDSVLAAHARLVFSTPFAAASPLTSEGELLYRHRFADPFADLSAQLALSPLPGPGSLTYVYTLSVLLLLTGVLGLGALYHMVSVVVGFAERRGNFVAAVTHELKTPLTAIRMYGEMLRDGMVPTQAKRDEYYRHITVESERLSRLINNVLEFSRLEKGNREVSLTRGDVGAVAREAADLLRPHLVEQGFELAVKVDEGLPPVRFERDALLQVLFNLIDNAAKYARDATPRRIDLSVGGVGGKVLLRVRDYGPGVPSRHLGKIFEAFYRGEDELTRRSKGTGLGLALVRGLVERMGGAVRARNVPEGGFEAELEFGGATSDE